MADVKISELPAAAVLDGAEVLPLVQNGETVQATAQDIADLAAGGSAPVVIQMSCSDLTSNLVNGFDVAYCRAPRAFTLTAVRASLLVASEGGLPVTVDILKNGVSILSPRITIDTGELTSVTAATPPVIVDDDINDDDELSVDIILAGTNAKGLIMTLIGE